MLRISLCCPLWPAPLVEASCNLCICLPPALQRTLRELEVGRTLVKDRQGRWVIRHGPGDYKVGPADCLLWETLALGCDWWSGEALLYAGRASFGGSTSPEQT